MAREPKMASHKFAVGQTLRFSPSLGEDSRRKGRYKVVRQLPEAGNTFQYRIKSETDGQPAAVRGGCCRRLRAAGLDPQVRT